MRVAICVITYQRPEGLKRLLNGLNQLVFSKCEVPNLEVIVVDNDYRGAACQFCQNLKSNFKWPLRCYVESNRGISYARNKTLSSVAQDIEFVAFIDDDEVPDPSWLDELLFVQKSFDANVVHGPVIPHFEDQNVPQWVIKGKFFEDIQRFATGQQLKVAYTNNVLIHWSILKETEKFFDDRFALTGGEDSHYFTRLYQAGYKIVSANEALVHEWIPKSRTTVQWLLRRGYRSWSTHSLCELEFNPSVKCRVMAAIKGSGLIGVGFLQIFPSLFMGKHARVRALLNISRGAGRIAGLWGSNYVEYATIHGT